MAKLYALLVAVDSYPEGIRSLAGCVNDADAMEELLTNRFGARPERIKRLNNEEAKRAAVIEAFRGHLGQAAKQDVALFFYAGHGSQVPTGGLFKEIEPDGMNESIVCYDSRVLGAYDLVDKDIATLIGELTAKGVHVTTIFDSCHSGSVTRDLNDLATNANESDWERKLEPRSDAQPHHAYLTHANVQAAATRNIASSEPGMGSLTLAAADYAPDETGLHVLLAACEDHQTAKEYFGGGKRHGAFTYFLTNTLRQATRPLGYRELMYLAQDAMRGRVAQQTPKLESSGGDAIFDNLFLGLAPSTWTDYAIASVGLNGEWEIDRGTLMRVSVGDRFALYPLNPEGQEVNDAGKPVAFARTTSIAPSRAELQMEDGVELDDGLHWKAVAVSRAAIVAVCFAGDPCGVALLEAAQAKAVPSFHVAPDPKFRVNASKGRFTVWSGGGDRLLWGPAPQDEKGANAVIAALEHMALWSLRVELANPATRIPAAAVEFVITQYPGTPDETEWRCPPLREVVLTYRSDFAGVLEKPAYKAGITNSSPSDVYLTLLMCCSDDWSISTQLIEAGTQRLAPGETVYAKSGRPIKCSVNDDRTDAFDDLVLVVSTDRFESLDFRMAALPAYGASERGMDKDDEPAAIPAHDFFTRRITFRTRLPTT